MLQTQAIKPDSSVTPASIKEKDPPAPALDTNFSSYFNQMMAALPAPLMDAAGMPAPTPAPAPRATPQNTRKSGQDSNPVQAAPPATLNGGTQGMLAAASTQAASPPQPAPSAPAQSGPSNASSQSVQSAQGAQGQSGPGSAGGAATLPGNASAMAALASAKTPLDNAPPAPTPAQTQPQTTQAPARAPVQTQDLSAPPAPTAPSPPPAPPVDPADAQAMASAKAALDQAYPGGKFQMQFDDMSVPATTKQPLSEFLNQLQMEPKVSDPAFQSAGLPADAMAPVAPATAATALMPTLAATAALPVALVAGSSAAVGSAMLKEAAPVPGAAVAGNLAPAMAVGAGAAPGAFGAVRVTAAQTADPPTPTRQQNPMSQVDGTIRWLVKNQDQGAELQLHPESLGQVQIKLKVEGNVVHAKLWASEASAIPVMQEHRAFIEESLRSQGLTLGSFDLQHGRRDDQAPTHSSSESTSAISAVQDRPRAGQESPVIPAAAAPRGNRIEYVA